MNVVVQSDWKHITVVEAGYQSFLRHCNIVAKSGKPSNFRLCLGKFLNLKTALVIIFIYTINAM